MATGVALPVTNQESQGFMFSNVRTRSAFNVCLLRQGLALYISLCIIFVCFVFCDCGTGYRFTGRVGWAIWFIWRLVFELIELHTHIIITSLCYLSLVHYISNIVFHCAMQFQMFIDNKKEIQSELM